MLTDITNLRTARTAALLTGLALTAVLLALTVVVLGAYVRLTAAGLGCPDWPGCYGHLTPDAGTALDVGKAWREMIHRYAASTLGLIIVVIAALALARRRDSVVAPLYAVALLLLVIVQGALGMQTVTQQLKPLIVTLHLLFGLTTLGAAWWLWLSLRSRVRRGAAGTAWPPSHAELSAERAARVLAALALPALVLQIALGGWTSSNYAAIACPDLPTCQGAWWPPVTDFHDAFVLWRAPAINYEGGVLQGPARVAIHFAHRLGAVLATTILLLTVLAVWRAPTLRRARVAALVVLCALLLQLTIGLSMVRYGFPLPLATAHNAGAALTLLAVLALYHRLYGRRRA